MQDKPFETLNTIFEVENEQLTINTGHPSWNNLVFTTELGSTSYSMAASMIPIEMNMTSERIGALESAVGAANALLEEV